jgi:hypothetical protein
MLKTDFPLVLFEYSRYICKSRLWKKSICCSTCSSPATSDLLNFLKFEFESTIYTAQFYVFRSFLKKVLKYTLFDRKNVGGNLILLE